ncbi:MAG: hypothetical protein HY520_04630 [Candidatus Aenigmarchaeota archaeon]|nr:hypothetical protein [Candidatus Aenigmarchaeota archaeon]
MQSVHEVFKLIFGVLASILILGVILTFVGNYGNAQERSLEAAALRNVIKSAGDVYVSGNGIPFRGVPNVTFLPGDPPTFRTPDAAVPVRFPLFFRGGEDLFLARSRLDMGWWSFSYVTATPRLRVLFSPVVGDWQQVRDIVSAFPDTEFFDPKVTFGVCDGTQLREQLCTGQACEQRGFRDLPLEGLFPAVAPCTALLPADAILITLSSSCPQPRGVCLTPPDAGGIGTLFSADRALGYYYKDPVDVAALAIGGISDVTELTLFDVKNEQFRTELRLAAEVLRTRILLITPSFPAISPCRPDLAAFLGSLQGLEAILGDEAYYEQYPSLQALLSALGDLRAAHESLAAKGCDY